MAIIGKQEGLKLSPFALFSWPLMLFSRSRLSSSRSAVSAYKPEARSWDPVSDLSRARGRVAVAGLKRTQALGTRLAVILKRPAFRAYVVNVSSQAFEGVT